MRVAVVGHVEWVEFAQVPRVPLQGQIIHVAETFEEPAGGGAVAAVQLRKLAGEATFFTALGDDELGHRVRRRLGAFGVRVEATFRDRPQRRAFTFLDGEGERTITTIGERLAPHGEDPLPWAELERADAVYVTAADAAALLSARKARVMVATSRILPDLVAARIPLDVLIGSAHDPDEEYRTGALDPPPRVVVATTGASGGRYQTADGISGAFPPAPLPGAVADSYGCGDSFAAGLAFAMGSGLPLEDALGLAARCGAACLTGHGPYERQLTLAT